MSSKNMTLTVKTTSAPEPIPTGVYQAKLSDLEKSEGDFGPYLKLTFHITDGDYKDTERTTIASMKLSTGAKNTKLYDIVAALMGKSPETSTEIDLGALVGKPCQILVKDKPGDKDGWQMISEVMPASK